MENQVETEKQQLDENVRLEIKDEPEKHNVHAEGTSEDGGDLNPKVGNEFKQVEPGGDNVEHGNGEEISQNLTSDKEELKDDKGPENVNLIAAENITLNEPHSPEEKSPKDETVSKKENASKQETAPKREHNLKQGNVPKTGKFDASETIPKSIGDRKRVKFLVDDDLKAPWYHNFQKVKARDTRDVYIVEKVTDAKRQPRTVEKHHSPLRDKSKDRKKVKRKGKERSRTVSKEDHENNEEVEAEDSGEEYWSKSNGDSSYRLNVEPKKSNENGKINAHKGRRKRSESLDCNSSAKHHVRRSASAENKKNSRDHQKVKKGEKRSSDIALDNSASSEKKTENSDTDIEKDFAHTIDIADMESTDSEDGDFTYDKKIQDDLSTPLNSRGDTNKKESLEGDDNPLTSDPVTTNQVDQNNPPDSTSAPANETRSWLSVMIDLFTNARCYRVTLCLGWLVWAMWIMRLMGVQVLSQLDVTGLANSVGLLEFMGLVEVFGLLQVLWLGWSNRRQPVVPVPAPVPAQDSPPNFITARASAPGLTRKISESAQAMAKKTAKTGSLDYIITST